VAGIARIQPGVEIRVTPPLDGHPAMAQVLIARIREGAETWNAFPPDGGPARRS
jgi:hypothetical protein